ncbi:hypothetical protein AB0H57_10455 [Micromonospora sp. NPDC050686]
MQPVELAAAGGGKDKHGKKSGGKKGKKRSADRDEASGGQG